MHHITFAVAEPRRVQGVQADFVLEADYWDDFGYKTSFRLRHKKGQTLRDIGLVKIARTHMRGADRSTMTWLPRSFSILSSDTFSLGQDREYYENLKQLPYDLGKRVLAALNDVAADKDKFIRFIDEKVMRASLMRDVPRLIVETQFHGITQGNESLTPYHFSFTRYPQNAHQAQFEIDFKVQPGQSPPTNIHVLIGANGVGKSKLLRDFVMTAASADQLDQGRFRDLRPDIPQGQDTFPFAGVVHVSFSAFDTKIPIDQDLHEGNRIVTVGLEDSEAMSLEDQFVSSIRRVKAGPRRERWLGSMEQLSSNDAILGDVSFDALLDTSSHTAMTHFRSMSSGHKIVILTMSRLVELVEERTLVLLDEPEIHLHPPLLSSLVRSVSDLMVDRNGVALIATHSPVVLQEVPAECVSVLTRVGTDFRAWPLDTESFGESVSRLTSEVFHLNVGRTGYHQVLHELLREFDGDQAQVLDALRDRLGSEGRFVLNALAKQYGPHV